MSTRKLILVIVAVLLLSVAVTACGGTGSTSTSPAAQALLDSANAKDAKEVAARAAATSAAAVPATEVSLKVGDKTLSLTDIGALRTATATVDGAPKTGISLLAVLEAGGITAETIVMTASDGTTAEVALADIDDTAIVQIAEDGTLDVTIPTIDKSLWVKDLASIAAK